MSMKSRPATASAQHGAGHGLDEVSRVAISYRVWAALGVLTLLLGITSVGLLMARSELGGVKTALQQAETSAKESQLRLRDALDDKQQVIKELSAQGNRLAEFSRDEEKARSALTVVSTGAEATQKHVADLKARLAKSRAQVRALRKENASLGTVKAEMAVLTGELDEMRTRLEQSEAKLNQLRSAAEPYSAAPRQSGQ